MGKEASEEFQFINPEIDSVLISEEVLLEINVEHIILGSNTISDIGGIGECKVHLPFATSPGPHWQSSYSSRRISTPS
jgi:hypothetical protein